MELEWAADGWVAGDCYPFHLHRQQSMIVVDWEPMVWTILDQLQQHVSISQIAGMLHTTLAAMIVAVAEQIGEPCVALSGGCFQNVRLLEEAVQRLRAAGFRPYWPQRIPPNDGGIALGQAVAAAQRLKSEER
jgi:hydrogenase maturation protein HypF